jgi:hypothetical protein
VTSSGRFAPLDRRRAGRATRSNLAARFDRDARDRSTRDARHQTFARAHDAPDAL